MPRARAPTTQKSKDDAFTRSARKHAAEAMRTLRTIHLDNTKETAARVAAATKIIEYGHGKPSSGEAPNVTTVNVVLDKTDQRL